MKRYLILLAFLPLLLPAQRPLPDILFKGNIAVSGSDTLLVDSITGLGSANFKLLNVDFSITLGYLPGKTETKLLLFGKDTIPIVCLFSNYNYADSLFIKWNAHTINLDSTELLERRITEIGFWNTPLTTTNKTNAFAYYGVPAYPSTGVKTVGVDKTYATISLAVAASSENDSILVFNGLYNEQVILTETMHLVCVGDAHIRGAIGRIAFQTANKTNTITGFQITATVGYVPLVVGTRTGGSVVINNCFVSRTSNNILNETTAANHPLFTFNNCVLLGTVKFTYVNNTLNNCYLKNPINNGSAIQIGNLNTTNILYSKLKKCDATTNYGICQSLAAFNTINIKYSAWEDNIWNTQASVFAGVVNLRGCASNLITSTRQLINSSSAKNMTWNIDRCSFTGGRLVLTLQKAINFDSCNLINNTGIEFDTDSILYSCNFTNNTINCNDDSYAYFYDYKGNIYNNIFICDSGFQFNIYTSITTSGRVVLFYDNLFSIKNNKSASPILNIGSETLNSYYDSVLVYGNKFNCPGMYGGIYGAMHTVFIGNQKTQLYNNYISSTYLGIVAKTKGINKKIVIHHNVFKNCEGGIILRGCPGVKMYNNTSRNDSVFSYFIYLDANNGVAPNAYGSDSCSSINNIFASYTIGAGNHYYFGDDTSNNAFISNNNIFYPLGDDLNIFNVSNPVLNFAQWQALGYDTNSFNSNPLFASSTQLWPTESSKAIGNGLNLGATYQTGLSTGATWPNPITRNQTNTWTIGAYVVNVSAPIYRHRPFFLMFNGNLYR